MEYTRFQVVTSLQATAALPSNYEEITTTRRSARPENCTGNDSKHMNATDVSQDLILELVHHNQSTVMAIA